MIVNLRLIFKPLQHRIFGDLSEASLLLGSMEEYTKVLVDGVLNGSSILQVRLAVCLPLFDLLRSVIEVAACFMNPLTGFCVAEETDDPGTAADVVIHVFYFGEYCGNDLETTAS